MAEGHCPTCGAAYDDDRLFCGQCGARVAAGVSDLEAYRTGAERFERVAVAPGHAAAQRHTPVLPFVREVLRPIGELLLGAVAAAYFLIRAIDSADLEVVAVTAAAGAIGLTILVRTVLVALARHRAPTERTIAIVTADQNVTSGRRRDPVRACDHRVTLRGRDGGTRDVFARGALMGEIGIGDIGVAYLRRDRLLDYRWFDVMAAPLAAGEPPRAAPCRACGAPQRFGPAGDLCAYCGARLEHPDLGEFGARFRAAAGSPAASEACSRRVAGGLPRLWRPLALFAGGAFFAWVAYQARELIQAGLALSAWAVLAPVILLAPLVAGVVWLYRSSAPHRARPQNQLAVVVRVRSELVRSSEDRQTWRYFATIAAPSGARRELLALQPTTERLRRGQIGIAHLRGDWLADFTVLDPPATRSA